MDKFEQHIKRMKNLQSVYEEGTGQHNILSMLINECEALLCQPLVIKSVCEKYPKPTQRYCYECEGCKKAMSEQTDT